MRCALVVHVPEKWADYAPLAMGSEIAAPVSFIDFVPTLLSIAGVEQPKELPGTPFLGRRIARPKPLAFGMRNRMDERYDFVRTVSDGQYRYIRNYMPHRPMGQPVAFPLMLRSYQDVYRRHQAGELDAAQARFFEPRPFEELYDLNADPDQLHNLANAPGQRARVRDFARALDRHMLAINDNGFIPEGAPLEGYEASRVPGAYPLADIMELAAKAAAGDPAHVSALIAGLAATNEVLRYWAATGLVIRKAHAVSARAALVDALKRETSPHVRIVLAEALSHVGETALALATFREALASGSEPVALQAARSTPLAGGTRIPAIWVARPVICCARPQVRSTRLPRCSGRAVERGFSAGRSSTRRARQRLKDCRQYRPPPSARRGGASVPATG
jgi:hypothetical protein